MPKSECVFGVASATADALRAGIEAGGVARKDAQKIVDNELKFLFGAGRSQRQQAETTVESVNFGIDALLARSSKIKAADEAVDPWFAKTKIPVSGKKGEAIQSSVFNQFSIVPAQARITGQVREWQRRISACQRKKG